MQEAETYSRASTADKIKRKRKQGNIGGCRKSERETAAHAEIAKRLEEAEAAMNKLSEKEKIIQEQENLIK